MPREPRPGKHPIYLELPEALFAWLEARREADRRTRTAAIILALEEYRDRHEPKQPKGAKR